MRVFEQAEAEQRQREAQERLQAEARQCEEKERLEVERRQKEEQKRPEAEPQSPPPISVAPSTPPAKPEATEPSVEIPKVIYPLPPKPVEPGREKPTASSSDVTKGKSPSKQVIAFLAIVAVLVIGFERSSATMRLQPIPSSLAESPHPNG
jgi:hypothetical protein